MPVVSYPEAQSCTTLNLEMLDCCSTPGLLLWKNSNREGAYGAKVGLCTLFCGFLSFVGHFPKTNFECFLFLFVHLFVFVDSFREHTLRLVPNVFQNPSRFCFGSITNEISIQCTEGNRRGGERSWAHPVCATGCSPRRVSIYVSIRGMELPLLFACKLCSLSSSQKRFLSCVNCFQFQIAAESS